MILEDLAILFGAWLPFPASCYIVLFPSRNGIATPGFYNGISTAEVDTLAAETCATADSFGGTVNQKST